MTDRKRTAAEGLRESSGHLRGALAAEVSAPEPDSWSEAARLSNHCDRVGVGTLRSRSHGGG